MTSFEAIEARLVEWGAPRADLRALMVVGSRARREARADAWSDLDVVLATTEPQRYLDDDGWLHAIGEPWLTFLQGTATGGLTERRVLFAGALDVDFIVIPAAAFRARLTGALSADVASVVARGTRFLLDKDGVGADMRMPDRPAAARPSQAEFDRVVSDFWYHAVWVTKKLLRGELWTALGGHAHMRREALLPVIEWHAQSRSGRHHDTWHGGRFIESWANPQTVRELGRAFARYDPDDIERSLLATMQLFARLAAETAEALGYTYAEGAQRVIERWVREALRERA